MSEKRRKKVNIDLAYVETKFLWSDSRIQISLYDGYKAGRKTNPVYVMQLEPYMASHLAEKTLEGLKLARDKIDKEIENAIAVVTDE